MCTRWSICTLIKEVKGGKAWETAVMFPLPVCHQVRHILLDFLTENCGVQGTEGRTLCLDKKNIHFDYNQYLVVRVLHCSSKCTWFESAQSITLKYVKVSISKRL